MMQGNFLLKSLPTTSRSCSSFSVLLRRFSRPMKGMRFNQLKLTLLFFLPRISSRSFSPKITVLSPKCCSSSSGFCSSCSSQSLSSIGVVCSKLCLASHSFRMFSPCFCCSRLARLSMACIFPRALAVETKLIHDGSTCCDLDVNISTWSPLCRR